MPTAGEVLERPFAAEDVAAATLGVWVQNLTLVQDRIDAQLQEQAVPVDDHHTLYDSDDHPETTDQLSDPRVLSPPCSVTPPPPLPPPPPPRPGRPRSDSIAQSFISPPAPNRRHDQHTQALRRPSPVHLAEPARPSFSPITDASPDSSLHRVPGDPEVMVDHDGGDQGDETEPAHDTIQEGSPGPDNIHQGEAPQRDEDNEDGFLS